MRWIMKILIILGLSLIVLFLFCACKVSSKCSREEEQNEKNIKDYYYQSEYSYQQYLDYFQIAPVHAENYSGQAIWPSEMISNIYIKN